MFQNRKRMFQNRIGCSILEEGCSKTENLVILFKKVCKSAIAHRTPKTSHTHALRTHSSKNLSARTSARTSHVRKCDFTHLCAATQHLLISENLPRFEKICSTGTLFWFLDVLNNFKFPTHKNSQKWVKNQKSTDKHSSFDSLIQEYIDLPDIYLAVQKNLTKFWPT